MSVFSDAVAPVVYEEGFRGGSSEKESHLRRERSDL